MSPNDLIYVIIVHIMVPVCSLVTYVFWLKDNLKTERRYREYAQNKLIATRDAMALSDPFSYKAALDVIPKFVKLNLK